MELPKEVLEKLGMDAEKLENEKQEEEDRKEREKQERFKNFGKDKRNIAKGKNGGQIYGGSRNDHSGYVGAPYNFVPFSKKVYEEKREQVSHAAMSGNLLSGEIRYGVTAHTPVFVGSGNGNPGDADTFYRNAKGEYAIPGSSMRGLIRSNVQILGFSAMGDEIDDYKLMYRSVGTNKSDPNKSIYNETLGSRVTEVNGQSVSVLKNVKAGYILKENGKYHIYHTKPDQISESLGEMNYYVINERHIIEAAIKDSKNKAFSYLFNENRTQNIPGHFFTKFEKGGRIQYFQQDNGKNVWNRDYRPYFEKVSYELKNERTVSAVGDEGRFRLKGYLVGTGYMQQKKALYLVPEIDREKYFAIPEDDIRAFRIDYEKKKNGLRVKNKEIFDLPKDGQMRPVFYVVLNGRVYFGYTPRLRLFYDHTIADGMPDAHRKVGMDLARSMFGYATMEKSYKSRISFSDAVMTNSKSPMQAARMVLGEPKASSYNDYLKTDCNGNAMSYANEGFELRGIKQYWLHDGVEKNDGNGNEKVMSGIKPLPKDTEFEGVIRFKNLRREELGLLLWAIRLEPGMHQNIGKAKALGYGNVSVKCMSLRYFDPEKAYNLDQLELVPWKQVEINEADRLINEYKDFMTRAIGVDDIMKEESISAFFKMKDDANKPDPIAIRYMNINKREYQNRRPLDDIDGVIKKSKNNMGFHPGRETG